MNKTVSRTTQLATITVGELISELCRWPDHAVVVFRCPLEQRELRFSRIQNRSKGVVEIELGDYPASLAVAPM